MKIIWKYSQDLFNIKVGVNNNLRKSQHELLARITNKFNDSSLVLSSYRSGTVNSNTVNSKFHLIRSFCEIFARFLSFHV